MVDDGNVTERTGIRGVIGKIKSRQSRQSNCPKYHGNKWNFPKRMNEELLIRSDERSGNVPVKHATCGRKGKNK